ncbi:MAG: hypothetical protein ACREOZ_04320, partial [Gloeomargaritales cyanobacterium]
DMVSLAIGQGNHKYRTLRAPDISAPAYQKAQAFDMLYRTLATLKSTHPCVDLISGFTHIIPVSSTVAEQEAEQARASILSAFFKIGNLHGLGFYSKTGAEVATSVVAGEIHERPDDIAYFGYRAVVSPITIDSRIQEDEFSLEFALKLPQKFRHTNTDFVTVAARRTMQDIIDAPDTEDVTATATTEATNNDATPTEPHLATVRSPQLLETMTRNRPSPQLREFLTRTTGPTAGTTFTGDLDFIGDQDEFTKTFGTTPTMITLSSDALAGCNVAEQSQSKDLAYAFADRCKFDVFARARSAMITSA